MDSMSWPMSHSGTAPGPDTLDGTFTASHPFINGSDLPANQPLSPNQSISPQARGYQPVETQPLLHHNSSGFLPTATATPETQNAPSASAQHKTVHEQKEDFQRKLGEVLVIRAMDGRMRAPIITLHADPANVFQVIEKHVRHEYLQGRKGHRVQASKPYVLQQGFSGLIPKEYSTLPVLKSSTCEVLCFAMLHVHHCQ
jgi:hypothetical protein